MIDLKNLKQVLDPMIKKILITFILKTKIKILIKPKLLILKMSFSNKIELKHLALMTLIKIITMSYPTKNNTWSQFVFLIWF